MHLLCFSFDSKMNKILKFQVCLISDTCIRLFGVRRLHLSERLVQRKRLTDDYYGVKDIESSLWYTNLPSRNKRAVTLCAKKNSKIRIKPNGSGPLLIKCKRQEYNHYMGTHYGKFDVIPLASKGWHHRKSRGDHFTVLPVTKHPAFLVSSKHGMSNLFEEMHLNPIIVRKLRESGAEHPTVIQAKAIPQVLEGKSILMAGETGCGKTFAYLAPLIHQVLNIKDSRDRKKIPSKLNSPLGVIILPTRELCIQVGMVAHQLCSNLSLNPFILLGGKTKEILMNPVQQEIDILVCTLGILSKLLTFNIVSMDSCRHLVLDEADTLLDDSFNDKLLYVLRKSKLKFGHLNSVDSEKSQLCLASATIPKSLDAILKNLITNEGLVHISTSYLHKILPHIPQKFIRVGPGNKAEQMLKIVKENDSKSVPTMIFCNKTASCNWLNLFLNENGIKSVRINGMMDRETRLEQYQKFRDGLADVICCTDLTSRGLDCTRVKHIVNYEFPRFVADYIHRCGRTGRIGHEEGCVITSLISRPAEVPLLNSIEKCIRTNSELENVNNNISRILRHKIRNGRGKQIAPSASTRYSSHS